MQSNTVGQRIEHNSNAASKTNSNAASETNCNAASETNSNAASETNSNAASADRVGVHLARVCSLSGFAVPFNHTGLRVFARRLDLGDPRKLVSGLGSSTILLPGRAG
jgi:hypothetical protein